ncbi:uncharacterized protein HKW66_Vig0178260 [Vigna angularis]|uniref:Uncharacterized protein n=1 Tax=Phaseolus angularis TaxID=3914 RepID=A0A8T0K0V3_PHAAN|nr:uncharacterized protein HKW66_Vig0178260 [Vigna angularis]
MHSRYPNPRCIVIFGVFKKTMAIAMRVIILEPYFLVRLDPNAQSLSEEELTQVQDYNFDHPDCAKHDPKVDGDTENNVAELLSEELNLRETEALKNQRRADMGLLESKKIASQYQKEADKCNSRMETCEEAREKAEMALVAQKNLSALWELRARHKGWQEGLAKSNSRSKGKLHSA